MQRRLISSVLAWAAVTSACVIPDTPLPNSITQPFRVQVQNASQPDVHNKFMNLLPAGGGDQHLFIGPVGNPTFDLTLDAGAITRGLLHAVIGGEFSTIDETTKMFTTERGDPRAIFAPTYACNPDTDELQVELRFVTKQNSPAGGWICVRPTYDGAHEFRYYPPGNTKVDPARTCIKVTLVVYRAGGTPPASTSSTTFSTSTRTSTSSTTSTTSTTSSTPSTTSTTSTTSTSSAAGTTSTSTSTSASSTASSSSTSTSSTATTSASPLPYTDLTASGFRFIGCAPEERTVSPPDGPFRTLPVLFGSDTLTNQICAAYCSSRGFAFAGTEYRRECWCGNSYAPTRQPGTTRASLAGCSQTCIGNTSQICGGGGWLSLYAACPAGGPCVNAQFT